MRRVSQKSGHPSKNYHKLRILAGNLQMSPGQVSDTPFKGTPFLEGIHYYITFYRLQYAV